ncbi:MAG: PQQ-dependent sugar dehydrogenase [Gemmatimonadota bacterium]
MVARFSSPVLALALGGLLALAAGCRDQPVLEPAAPSADHNAQPGPTVLDPNLDVRTVVSGLSSPTTMAFLGPDDFLVLEKNTGRVKRVVGGVVQGTVLDLAVNFASERGLLGIALHPNFPADPGVYLFWTESTTGTDSNVLGQTPLLGNRVDRFVWNGSTLTQAGNVVRLRAIQQDPSNATPANPLGERGNHNGGILRFGHDGKLYVIVGDTGRRGWMQNLRCGPTNRYDCPPGAPVADDQFGGPQPDAAHLTGVVLRLNPDGTAPGDNPFFAAGAAIGGEVGASVQKVFSYGHRNSFGMAVDPESGALWLEENGDDSFTELNLVEPGMNGGWVQIMGPVSRLAQFRAIETSPQFFGLQQARWPSTNIATSPEEALSRLFMLPGARYSDPEFSWKYEVAPAGIGFIQGRALGPQYDGDLVVGAARDVLFSGHLFRFNLTGNRRRIAVDDPRLEDRVADNLAKHDVTESESLVFGENFGVGTDIQTGPNGSLYVVSLTHGAVYEIFRGKNGKKK